ncbi:MAG: hypothetical protein HY010_20955 [Acidobacteria bacterium]|nr:hypothetical protein [Acidobacteriota bacterium]
MTHPRHCSAKPLALVGISLVALLFVACNQKPSSTNSRSSPRTLSADIAPTTVFIQFEGPWAFAPDPQDPNGVLALAPKAQGHLDLYVKASNAQTLASGIYTLSLPTTTAGAGTLDPDIVQAQVTPAGLQHTLDATGLRYAVRLPKPDAYIPGGRAESRVGGTYPPPASTQGNHITAVSLRYAVSSLTGFSISGTPDTGTLNPVPLNVETPLVRVVIEPAQLDDPLDQCETHSRESFRDLVKLLGVTQFVDFPNYTSACQQVDPQRAANQRPRTSQDRLAAAWNKNLWEEDMQAPRLAGVGFPAWISSFGNGKMRSLLAYVVLFTHPAGDCRSPILALHF